jgi:hypothetical protein
MRAQDEPKLPVEQDVGPVRYRPLDGVVACAARHALDGGPHPNPSMSDR